MTSLKTALLASTLVLATGFAPDWMITVAETDAGHLIGNPKAETRVAEYISYTCGHCADFARQGDPALKVGYVRGGKVSVEIRHLLRDPIDLTAAMLAHCGAADKFPLNHAALMIAQEKWLPVAAKATPAQQQRWSNADRAAARRAIAADLDFYQIMEARGYRTAELDRCMADSAMEAKLVKASRDDTVRLGLKGTPSFTLNGKLLENVHRWPALQQAIDAQLAAKPKQNP
ncbi:MAG: DsbA family protein [Erythrobacter sp.]